jgi:site-specific recombinase XerD
VSAPVPADHADGPDAGDDRPEGPRTASRPRAGASLTERLATTLSDYRAELERADLSAAARRAYASRVAGYLDWLDTGPDLAADGDPLSEPAMRDYAVRDYRSWLKTVRRAPPTTVNAHLTALDHFYAYHLGIGAPTIKRERATRTAPESLEPAETRRYIRACGRSGSPRNEAIGTLFLYSGLRVEEVEALDLDDIVLSARRGKVIVRDGKGGVFREVPLHRAARTALRAWLDIRVDQPGAEETTALLLSRRGQRLRERALRYVVAELGRDAGLVHDPGHPQAGKSRVHPHTLRHTFATMLLRNGVDIVIVADLMGHAQLDTTRIYTASSDADRAHAVETGLIVDE